MIVITIRLFYISALRVHTICERKFSTDRAKPRPIRRRILLFLSQYKHVNIYYLLKSRILPNIKKQSFSISITYVFIEEDNFECIYSME